MPEVSSAPFCSRFERFLLSVEALRSQVVGSPADIIELPIRLIVKGFRFKEERMRVIDFLAPWILFLRLGLSLLSSLLLSFHT